MALGQLVVSLGLDASEFVSGMSKSELQAKRFGQQLDRTIAVGIVKAQVAIEAFSRGIGVAVDAFKTLTTGAANFKDLEETTGATAESIASLAVAAATAGVDINDVAGATQKLTKNLVGVDDESKAAGAALKALNINVSDFKKLDPVGQYEAIGKALGNYADGAQKVAVAQALFGKSGAEQLKVFKALEEAGGRQTILTQRQIELADAYADRQAKSAAALRLYAQAAASEALPALTDLTQVAIDLAQELLGVDKVTGKLSANNGAKAFAEGVADSFVFAADQVDLFVRLAQLAGKAVGGYFAVVSAFATGGIAAAREAGKAAEEDIERVINRATFAERLAKQRLASAASAVASFSDSKFEASRKPTLDFEGAQKTAKATKEALSDAQKYLQNLQDQITATQELTTFEKLLAEIRNGKLKVDTFSADYIALSLAAQEVDANKELNRLVKERADFKNKDYQAGNDAAAANATADQARLTNLLSGTEQALFDKRQSDLVVLQNAFEKGAIGAEQYGQAVKNLFGITDEGAKDSKRAVDELNMSFQSAFEDAIVEGKKLGDVLKALEKDLIRIALRKLVIEPAANSLTSSLGGLFGGGGGTAPGGGDFVGPPQLATGMDYVPYDGFIASLHKGERVVPAAEAGAQRRSGGGTVIETHGAPPMQVVGEKTDPDGQRRFILAVVRDDMNRGGGTAQAVKNIGNRPWIQR